MAASSSDARAAAASTRISFCCSRLFSSCSPATLTCKLPYACSASLSLFFPSSAAACRHSVCSLIHHLERAKNTECTYLSRREPASNSSAETVRSRRPFEGNEGQTTHACICVMCPAIPRERTQLCTLLEPLPRIIVGGVETESCMSDKLLIWHQEWLQTNDRRPGLLQAEKSQV